MTGRIVLWAGSLLLLPVLCRAESCTPCHGQIPQPSGWEHRFTDWQESLHAQVGVDCVSCHGGDGSAATPAEAHHGMTPVGGGNTAATRLLAAKVCGSCHVDKYRAFARSTHYRRLVEGEMAAYCHTCHTSVGSQVLTTETIAATCRACHPAEGNMAVATRARRLLANITRLRVAVTFRAPAPQRTPAEWETLRRTAIDAMDQWHAFDLDGVESTLAQNRPLPRVAGPEP